MMIKYQYRDKLCQATHICYLVDIFFYYIKYCSDIKKEMIANSLEAADLKSM